jgi:CRISPR system Cascade subunit CasB
VFELSEEIRLYGFVRTKIELLSGKSSQNKESSWSRAMLAKLRRGVGKAPGSVPEIWEITIGDTPDEWQSRKGVPSKEEFAVHTALTLYALHQQGKSEPMSVSGKNEAGKNLGCSFGEAAARLIAPDRSNEQAVKRRFDAAATASDPKELAHHARGLIQLLKAKDIPMDYPRFAQDLFWYQFTDYADGVRLRWGEDFYRRWSSAGDETKNDRTQSKTEENENE